ncbi:MAG: carbohydrate ABC transporter permease [Ardenticatenales bacterium]|nr:carbohydrate ABC transporter permease [Ardenticatenales bacterium]
MIPSRYGASSTLSSIRRRKQRSSKQSTFYRPARWLLYLCLILGSAVTLLPFVWMLLASLKSASEILRIPPTLWPENPTLASYRTIFSDSGLGLWRFYFNSIFVAGCSTILVLFSSSLGGYLFAKHHFPGKDLLYGTFLISIMLPFQIIMIPRYLLLVNFQLVDSLWGLILPAAVSAVGIVLMRQYVDVIPNEILDAARIDGATEWTIYWRIVLPQLRSELATIGILFFMLGWNNYLWPLIVITTPERRTLPVLFTWYSNGHSNRLDLTMAVGVLVIIPMLLVYMVGQRWIIRGIAWTGSR